MKWHHRLGILLGLSCWAVPASADLRADVQALSTARASDGRVVRLKPRLLEHGERLPVALAPELLDEKADSCVTVSLLGVPETHFLIYFSRFDPGAPSTAFAEASAAGAAEVTRCGSGKPFLASMVVEMRSPRAVLETLVSTAHASTAKLTEILPARDPGEQLSLGDPGGPAALPPLSQRLARLSARARREGAQSFERATLLAGADGSGGMPITLDPGCHELTLLAESAPTTTPPAIDLDLELVEPNSGAPVALDRADNADAALSYCTGEPLLLELRFVGATARLPLTLTRAHWALPSGLRRAWGGAARGRFAQLARGLHLPLPSPPLYDALGVQGTTSVPFQTEPDACYTALLIPVRGEAARLSLTALAHAPGEAARGAADAGGTGLSFCAHGARRATLEVGGEGSNLAWLLAIWETGRSRLGEAAQ
ncbi:MAG: hypothetical protein ABJB12_16190 [Pseudomonadota bacterium]